MSHPLESSVLRIRDTAGKLTGAAFLIAPGLAVTCAHVITDAAKRVPGQTLNVQVHTTGQILEAEILSAGWSPKDSEDVAFLHLPENVVELRPVVLAESSGRMHREGAALGFPSVPHWALGKLKEPIEVNPRRRPLLPFDGSEIAPGMSGGPLRDETTGQVVGMVCGYWEIGSSRSAYAVTAETIAGLCPIPLTVVSRAASQADISFAWLELLLEALRSQAGAIEICAQDPHQGTYFQVGGDHGNLTISNALVQELFGKARGSGNSEQREAVYLTEMLFNTTRARWEREYLPLSGSLHPARMPSTLRIKDNDDPKMSPAGEPLNDLRDALMERKKSRLVILGEPGCGKTTTLERLTLDLAHRRLKDPQHEKLPLLVDLFEFNMMPPNPEEFLRSEWRRAGLNRDFDQVVLNGEICFLLDGLNQMPFDDRADRTARLNHWAQKLAGDNWAVFTCRSIDYQTPLNLPEVHVQQLDAEHIQRYLKLRLGEENSTQLQNAQHDFEAFLNSGDHRFKDLARNIFMLSLLVERVLEGKPLTTNRADLMADLAERRLCRELTDGRHPAHLLQDPKTTLGAADVALSRLGYAMQTDRGATVLDETSAQAAVKDAQPSRLSVQEVFALVVGSGLLEQKRAEDGRLSYVFYHHLLQEYFAGRELLRRFKAGEDLSTHWKVSWQAPHPLFQRLRRTQQSKYIPPPPVTGWEETTRMAAVQAGVHLEKLVKAVARWNLPLAGRCLADAGSLDSPQCDNFRIELLKRQRNPRAQLPARIDAGLALGDLGHSELKAQPFLFEGQTVYAVRPPMQPIPAGVFLLGSDPNDQEAFQDEITSQRTVDLPAFSMGRYLVTNGEYRWFIEAGGYNCQLWWSPEGWEWRCGGPEAHAGPMEDWLAYRSWLMQGENLKKQAQRMLWSESNTAFWREMTALSFEEAKAKARRIFSRPFDRPAYWDDPRLNAALLPVVGVNLHEACAYAGWLSAVTGTPYALPLETHWEKAARGTNGRIYPWDGPFDSSRCNTVESGIRQPTPVGLFPSGASPFGLMDAAGCVWEWSESYYQAYPGGNPQASSEFGEKYRVVRGGSWGSDRRLARCAYRFGIVPDNFSNGSGFRLFSPGLFLDSDR